jgi:hypothetical protein
MAVLWIKRICSMVLLACFFLPLARCTTKAEACELPASCVTKSSEPDNSDISAFSLYQSADVQTVEAVFLFAWPLLLQLLNLRFPQLGSSRVTMLVELVLTILTIAAVVSLISWLAQWGTQLRNGSYLAILAVAMYGLIGPVTDMLARRQKPPG